tara:strand:+ start:5193 stop:5687 length:495 start_codon:yes stop_codon:yes gene_type:complete
MADWKKYSDTKEINDEIDNADHGFMVVYNGVASPVIFTGKHNEYNTKCMTRYLICEPQPHAEMQAIWAKTGRPVEYFHRYDKVWTPVAGNPSWNDINQYRFAEPKKEVIYYRNYQYKDTSRNEKLLVGVAYLDNLNDLMSPAYTYYPSMEFTRWLGDRQEMEID